MKFDLGPDLRSDDTPQDEKAYVTLRHVLSEIHPGRSEALEFGVATGKTLAMIAERMPVTGFDSFRGLPEDWRPGYSAGVFDGLRPGSEIPSATLVEGWFEDTLPTFAWPEEVSLVHIDCDLYSSTSTVLIALNESGLALADTWIVFDEFHGYEGCEQHEQKAWAEFIEETGYDYEVIGHGDQSWAVYIP